MAATAHLPVEMLISSDGGDVHFMFALYDAIRLSKVPIHTVATGVVASAATMLLVAGADRRATPNTWYMHHQVSSDITGNLDELTLRTKVTKQMAKVFYEILARHSTKNARFWEQAAKRKNELWLNAKEMVAHGVIDGIVEEVENVTETKEPTDV
jgi:ATP-dependent Clp protease protease subunit